jgi:hypothetical protein
MAMKSCCGSGKLCAITCCPCGLDIKKLIPLVNKPKFICKACGRVANKKSNLCAPKAL